MDSTQGVYPSATVLVVDDTPDNLIQVILHGIQEPANGDLGYMPGFKDSLDERQMGQLIRYLRARFAPAQPAWTMLGERLSRLRATPPSAHASPTTTTTPGPTLGRSPSGSASSSPGRATTTAWASATNRWGAG